MQTSKFLTALALVAASSASMAQSGTAAAPAAPATPAAPANNSVSTVEQLLRAENTALTQAPAPATGTPMALGGLAAPSAPVLRIASIYGSDNNLRANLEYKGKNFQNVAEGARVETYVVKSIAGKCVELTPAKAGKRPKNLSACWTGVAPVMAPPMGMNPSGTSAGMGSPLFGPNLPSGLMPAPLGAPRR